MTRKTKVTDKAGMPPGVLFHVGDERSSKINIQVVEYTADNYQEQELTTLHDCYKRNECCITWVNVCGIHKVDIIEKMGKCFDLHSLVLEDILNTNQRPKIEEYSKYSYIVLKMFAGLNSEETHYAIEQVSMIVGNNYIITFFESEQSQVFHMIRERLRSNRGRLRKNGADYLAYEIIDAIVDNYFVNLEHLGEKIEHLEDRLLINPKPLLLKQVHHLKRDLLVFRKMVWPLREIISALERGQSGFFSDPTLVYVRDVYDHTIQVIDTIEMYRDIMSSMLDIYLSSVSNRMNEVMKVLTIISTIFIPLTFLAGLYGMNFKYMPELEWEWGYPTVLLLMLVIVIGMVRFFRGRKWL